MRWLDSSINKLFASRPLEYAGYSLRRLDFPSYPNVSAKELASRFRFTELVLPEAQRVGVSADRLWRSVNPSLSGISGWISSLGASIAITDLDGDGFPNDLCYVDPRSDQVIVTPAPSTGSRYAAFSLRWGSSRGGTVAPMGCLPGDLNEDGWMDLLIYFWGRSPAVFLRIPGKALRGRVHSAGAFGRKRRTVVHKCRDLGRC